MAHWGRDNLDSRYFDATAKCGNRSDEDPPTYCDGDIEPEELLENAWENYLDQYHPTY